MVNDKHIDTTVTVDTQNRGVHGVIADMLLRLVTCGGDHAVAVRVKPDLAAYCGFDHFEFLEV
jgi:hypothetical protein